MIKAKHHKVVYRFFQKYTLRKMRGNFSSVELMGEYVDSGKPVFVLSNHISWWDGFWLMYLKIKMLNRKFHFMMLEEQLRKHWYFNLSGGYSVKKNSRSIIESLNYTAELLTDKHNMVIMFPQGKLISMHTGKVKFESGVDYVLRKCESEIDIIFVANVIEYFDKPKPKLFIHFQQCNNSGSDIEQAYNTFYESVINHHKTLTC